MANLIDSIEVIPNEADVWIQVTHTKAQGDGFVMATHYSFPVDVKSLKKLARAYSGKKSTWWERFKEWMKNLTT